MTGLLIAIALLLLAGFALKLGARVAMRDMAAPGAALLFGLAGYAWQGHPGQPGADAKTATAAKFDERLAEKRRAIGERIGPASRWLVLSDGIARQGNTQDAANVLVSGLKEHPNDPDLWVGLGNALLAHNGGRLSPAAEHAYRRALTLKDDGISAHYFYGLALAQSGDFDRAKAVWTRLAGLVPEKSDMHAEMQRDIGALDELIAQRDAQLSGNGQPAS